MGRSSLCGITGWVLTYSRLHSSHAKESGVEMSEVIFEEEPTLVVCLGGKKGGGCQQFTVSLRCCLETSLLAYCAIPGHVRVVERLVIEPRRRHFSPGIVALKAQITQLGWIRSIPEEAHHEADKDNRCSTIAHIGDSILLMVFANTHSMTMAV